MKRDIIWSGRLVMVFGVFDRLHAGHRAFLAQAKRRGGELIVVVARDAAVRKLKSRAPRERERTRLAGVRRVPGVARAVLGDRAQGTYSVIKKWHPDDLLVGYDQDALQRDLLRRMKSGYLPMLPIARLKAYKPEVYRSSLMRASVL